jgi:crotonobetainyl-CoA:carnitine CoA-transferase CaiB-like acyl-CoA transferase
MIVAVANDGQFQKFAACIGKQEWQQDSRFSTNADRVAHRDELIPAIAAVLRERSLDDWLSIFDGSGVPVSPINTIDRVFADPQVESRQIQSLVDDVPMVANPMRFSRSPMVADRRPPKLGEHDERLLDLLGLTEEALTDLKNKNIVGRRK